jgi:hypothetical protein
MAKDHDAGQQAGGQQNQAQPRMRWLRQEPRRIRPHPLTTRCTRNTKPRTQWSLTTWLRGDLGQHPGRARVVPANESRLGGIRGGPQYDQLGQRRRAGRHPAPGSSTSPCWWQGVLTRSIGFKTIRDYSTIRPTCKTPLPTVTRQRYSYIWCNGARWQRSSRPRAGARSSRAAHRPTIRHWRQLVQEGTVEGPFWPKHSVRPLPAVEVRASHDAADGASCWHPRQVRIEYGLFLGSRQLVKGRCVRRP